MHSISNSFEITEQSLESRDRRRSFAVSGLILALFFALTSTWWKALLFPVPQSQEAEYVVVGTIDFGNFEEGSGDVNNFLDPSANPGPEEPAPSHTENQAQSSQVSHEKPIITSSEPSDIKVPENPNPDPNPQPVVTEPKPKVKRHNVSYESDGNGTAEQGGANHGNGDKTGNRGNPDAKVLYDQGGPTGDVGTGGKSYDFKDLKRKAVSLPAPVYNVQKEARLTFRFKIAPNGKVILVESPVSPHTELVKAGKDAIYKWKFNEVADEAPDEWVSVTINFKLK